jgi:hypothetical protein
MNDLIKIIEAHRSLSFVGPFVWILLWVVASIIYRKSRGKAILPSKPKNSLFYEGQTSTTGFTLVNDSVIRRTLVELEDKWKPDPLGQRFFELKARFPVIPKKKESSGPAPALYREPAAWPPEK